MSSPHKKHRLGYCDIEEYVLMSFLSSTDIEETASNMEKGSLETLGLLPSSSQPRSKEPSATQAPSVSQQPPRGSCHIIRILLRETCYQGLPRTSDHQCPPRGISNHPCLPRRKSTQQCPPSGASNHQCTPRGWLNHQHPPRWKPDP